MFICCLVKDNRFSFMLAWRSLVARLQSRQEDANPWPPRWHLRYCYTVEDMHRGLVVGRHGGG